VVVAAAHITPSALWVLTAEYTRYGLRIHAATRRSLPAVESPLRAASELIPPWLATASPAPSLLHIALSPELAALVHPFPLESGEDSEQLITAAEAELKQFLTDYDRDSYTTFVLPLTNGGASPDAVAIPYPRAELEYLRDSIGMSIGTIVPDLFTLPALWQYNYPDSAGTAVTFLHLQPPYVDMLTLTQGRITALETARLPEAEGSETVIRECLRILAHAAAKPAETILLFGEAVHRDLLTQLQAALVAELGLSAECKRLNAFRMCLPPADERLRAYAVRTAHLFWGCVGACLPQTAGFIVS